MTVNHYDDTNQGAKGYAVYGGSVLGTGLWGSTESGWGVWGGAGSGIGVRGGSNSGIGVRGGSDTNFGVEGASTDSAGVVGRSTKGAGVYAVSDAGPALRGYSKSGKAGLFEGNVDVTGNVNATGNVNVAGDVSLTGADCAEDFDASGGERIEAGTVVVIDDEGSLHPSQYPYDKKVAGVVSGAGSFKPGLVLDRQESRENRVPVALMGKVECKVDADHSPIEVGALLTTSPTPGHAMKAEDPFKAFGAVIGKALRPLESGQQLIPILIALQ